MTLLIMRATNRLTNLTRSMIGRSRAARAVPMARPTPRRAPLMPPTMSFSASLTSEQGSTLPTPSTSAPQPTERASGSRPS